MKRRLHPSGSPCHGHNPWHRHHLLPPGRRLLAGTPTPPQPGSRQSRRTGIHLLAAAHRRRHRDHTNLHPTGYHHHTLSGACRHIPNRLGRPRDGIPPANPATLRLRYRHTPAAAVRPPSSKPAAAGTPDVKTTIAAAAIPARLRQESCPRPQAPEARRLCSQRTTQPTGGIWPGASGASLPNCRCP